MSWIIYNIEPNVFNVISDLFALVIVTLFSMAIGFVYPYVVWDSIKRGRPVPMDGILEPPHLWDTLKLIRNSNKQKQNSGTSNNGPSPPLPSMWILLAIPVTILMAFLAHTMADSFLDFDSVQVGTNDTYFLSSEPGGVSTHALLTADFPELCRTITYPGIAAVKLLQEADLIARGASRFSVFPPDLMNLSYPIAVEGLIGMVQGEMHVENDVSIGVTSIPGRLGVECKSPNEQVKRPSAEAVPNENNEDYFPIGKNSAQVLTSLYSDLGTVSSETEFLNQPNCNYETMVEEETIEDNGPAVEWEIKSWSLMLPNPRFPGFSSKYVAFGMRDLNNDLRWYLEFSLDEVELSCFRDDWRFGRSVRDGIVLAIGLAKDASKTPWELFEPYLLYQPGGIEMKMEYSVISGPPEEAQVLGDEPYYTLSSWTKECPTFDDHHDGNFSHENITGCVIDLAFTCSELFPQDLTDTTAGTGEMPTYCTGWAMTSMVVTGIEVDRGMLAAYAGIATRNQVLKMNNTLVRSSEAMNSLAAAYILTRKVVPGTVANFDVRPIVHGEYIFFMLVPFICLVPFVFFLLPNKRKFVSKSLLPVPSSAWDVIFLAKQALDTVVEKVDMPTQSSCDLQSGSSVFPKEPTDVKFGFTSGDSTRDPVLGLGKEFPALSAARSGASGKNRKMTASVAATTPVSKPALKKASSSLSSKGSQNQQVDNTSAMGSDLSAKGSQSDDDESTSRKSGGDKKKNLNKAPPTKGITIDDKMDDDPKAAGTLDQNSDSDDESYPDV